MSDFTKFYKDLSTRKTRNTMRAKSTMKGKRFKNKEIVLNTPHTKAVFRKSKVNMDRDYNFPIRRMKYRDKGVIFRRGSLKVPKGVKFESDGMLKAIYAEYGKSYKARASKRDNLSSKITESRLKRESGDISLKEEKRLRNASRQQQGSISKQKKELKPEQQTDEIMEANIIPWDDSAEISPSDYETYAKKYFQAQCYNCYNIMDVKVSKLPIMKKCPTCKAKNLFKSIPKNTHKRTQEPESWYIEVSDNNYPDSKDSKANEMNNYGEKLMGQGFYKAAIYWFDQALATDPDFRKAKRNKTIAKKYSKE